MDNLFELTPELDKQLHKMEEERIVKMDPDTFKDPPKDSPVFELHTLKEYKQIQAFKEKHKNCIRKNPTTIGGGFSYIFTPTGIGTAVSIKCNVCNEVENCTDYDCW